MTPETWRHARSILADVLDVPDDQRDALLAARCGHDARLRREVESLLVGCDGATLNGWAHASHARRPREDAAGLAPTAVGTTGDAGASATIDEASVELWGHFLLLHELGRGGFGVVHHAWDPALQRDVALKLIDVSHLSSRRSDVLLREGRMLARVRHPNVVVVYGTQRCDEQIGLAMEYVKGRTLGAVVAQNGPLGHEEAVVIGLTLCDALAAVHHTGLVHRDIKAANVMREQGGRIVLMDFGAGHDIEPGRRHASIVAGTPAYMSPEVLTGQAATPASDVYSLGVLLFHLVTGRFPVEAVNYQALLEAHTGGARRGLLDLRPELPGPFVEIVEHALAPLDTRPGTATAFRRELSGLLWSPLSPRPRRRRRAGERPPRPTPPFEESSRATAMRPGLVALTAFGAACAALLLTICVGLVTTLEFNAVLGRSGPFAAEPFALYLSTGLKALLAPFSHLVATVLLVNGALLLMRLAMLALPATVVAAVTKARGATSRHLAAAGLTDPATVGQFVCLIALLGITAIVVAYNPLFSAYMARADTAPGSELALLGYDNKDAHSAMRLAASAVLAVLGLGLLRVVRLRAAGSAEARESADWWPAASIIAGMVIVLMLQTAPWRLVWDSQFHEATFDGHPCFVVGEDRTRKLLHCPRTLPPRNRVVRDGDARLVESDRISPLFKAHAGDQPASPVP